MALARVDLTKHDWKNLPTIKEQWMVRAEANSVSFMTSEQMSQRISVNLAHLEKPEVEQFKSRILPKIRGGTNDFVSSQKHPAIVIEFLRRLNVNCGFDTGNFKYMAANMITQILKLMSPASRMAVCMDAPSHRLYENFPGIGKGEDFITIPCYLPNSEGIHMIEKENEMFKKSINDWETVNNYKFDNGTKKFTFEMISINKLVEGIISATSDMTTEGWGSYRVICKSLAWSILPHERSRNDLFASSNVNGSQTKATKNTATTIYIQPTKRRADLFGTLTGTEVLTHTLGSIIEGPINIGVRTFNRTFAEETRKAYNANGARKGSGLTTIAHQTYVGKHGNELRQGGRFAAWAPTLENDLLTVSKIAPKTMSTYFPDGKPTVDNATLFQAYTSEVFGQDQILRSGTSLPPEKLSVMTKATKEEIVKVTDCYSTCDWVGMHKVFAEIEERLQTDTYCNFFPTQNSTINYLFAQHEFGFTGIPLTGTEMLFGKENVKSLSEVSYGRNETTVTPEKTPIPKINFYPGYSPGNTTGGGGNISLSRHGGNSMSVDNHVAEQEKLDNYLAQKQITETKGGLERKRDQIRNKGALGYFLLVEEGKRCYFSIFGGNTYKSLTSLPSSGETLRDPENLRITQERRVGPRSDKFEKTFQTGTSNVKVILKRKIVTEDFVKDMRAPKSMKSKNSNIDEIRSVLAEKDTYEIKIIKTKTHASKRTPGQLLKWAMDVPMLGSEDSQTDDVQMVDISGKTYEIISREMKGGARARNAYIKKATLYGIDAKGVALGSADHYDYYGIYSWTIGVKGSVLNMSVDGVWAEIDKTDADAQYTSESKFGLPTPLWPRTDPVGNNKVGEAMANGRLTLSLDLLQRVRSIVTRLYGIDVFTGIKISEAREILDLQQKFIDFKQNEDFFHEANLAELTMNIILRYHGSNGFEALLMAIAHLQKDKATFDSVARCIPDHHKEKLLEQTDVIHRLFLEMKDKGVDHRAASDEILKDWIVRYKVLVKPE